MTGLRSKRIITDTVIYVVLIFMLFIWLFPLVWMIGKSVDEKSGSMSTTIFPETFTLRHYRDLFPGGVNYKLFPYFTWFTNTLIVACISCIISTLLVLMVSYALSRLRFKTRKKLMNISLILGLFPGFLSLIALYCIFNSVVIPNGTAKGIKLTDNLVGLALAYSLAAGNGFYIVKGFFDTVPMAIDEAARIDGASKNRIFWQMILPLSKPIIIYTILTNFIGPWCDYIMASAFMRDEYKLTVAPGIRKWIKSQTDAEIYFSRFCAGGIFISVPIILLYMVMQKFYVSGITGGAAKG